MLLCCLCAKRLNNTTTNKPSHISNRWIDSASTPVFRIAEFSPHYELQTFEKEFAAIQSELRSHRTDGKSGKVKTTKGSA